MNKLLIPFYWFLKPPIAIKAAIIGAVALFSTTFVMLSAQVWTFKSATIIRPVEVPEWFYNLPSNPDVIYGTGYGQNESLPDAIEESITNARAEAAKSFECFIKSSQRLFTEDKDRSPSQKTYFQSVITSTCNIKLKESKVINTSSYYQNNQYTAFALISVLRTDIVETPDDSTNQDEVESAFERLDRDLKEYEEWKRIHENDQKDEAE